MKKRDQRKKTNETVTRALPGTNEAELSATQRRGVRRLLSALGLGPKNDGRRAGAPGAAALPNFGFTPKEGRYVRERTIAQGGMGTIVQVTDQDLSRVTAMKVGRPDVMASPKYAWQFVTEARITAQLEHPNIVPVHDIGQTDADGLFFTMKLVAGEPLNQILHRLALHDRDYRERYDRHQLLLIFRKVCEAIAFAHSRGVVHRDIKPHNIMVGRYGEVLLMDWGLAKYADAPPGSGCEPDAPPGRSPVATSFGTVKGTPAYMSPEQARGLAEMIDERSDVFLLGATLYHCLTLMPPYTGGDSDEVLRKALRGKVQPPDDANPGAQIPEELCRITMRALARDREERYASVEELIEDVDAWMAGKTLSEHRLFRAGEVLIHAGDSAAEAYAIVRGQVDVYREAEGRRVHLTALGPGEVVGEMALITSEPRSATVVAREDTEVHVINQERMAGELRKLPPWMGRVVNALAERLQSANCHIHPLLAGPCFGHVAEQLRLLVTAAQAEGVSGHLSWRTTTETVAENLAIPRTRARAALRALVDAGLAVDDEQARLSVPDTAVLAGFAAYCRQVRNGHAAAGAAEPPDRQERYRRILAELTDRAERDAPETAP